MACSKDTLQIVKGKTFNTVLRWAQPHYIYKQISAISQTAPVSITATAHGVPEGWSVAIASVRGMTQINAKNYPPDVEDYTPATVVDPNTITLNAINAADYKTYTSGGYVQYRAPVDLTGYTARMTVKDRVGGTELFSLTTENSRIVIDNTVKTIVLTISATDTASIDWSRGVYDLELVSSGGQVTALLNGSVSVSEEVTT